MSGGKSRLRATDITVEIRQRERLCVNVVVVVVVVAVVGFECVRE